MFDLPLRDDPVQLEGAHFLALPTGRLGSGVSALPALANYQVRGLRAGRFRIACSFETFESILSGVLSGRRRRVSALGQRVAKDLQEILEKSIRQPPDHVSPGLADEDPRSIHSRSVLDPVIDVPLRVQ